MFNQALGGNFTFLIRIAQPAFVFLMPASDHHDGEMKLETGGGRRDSDAETGVDGEVVGGEGEYDQSTISSISSYLSPLPSIVSHFIFISFHSH